MGDVFEAESNASQDGRYRDHLDRNWDSGNKEFRYIRNQLVLWGSSLDSLRDDLNARIDNLQQQHGIDIGYLQDALSRQWTQVQKNASDINNLGVDLQNHLDQDKKDKDGIDARLKKLEDAVFGLNPIEIDNPPVPDYPSGGLVGINSDDRTRKDKNRW